MKINREIEMYEFIPEEIKKFKKKTGIYALIHDGEVFYVG